jgi:murein DD-endopeptidase MepM/ murein hydrolase activator NlpD
MVPRQKKKKKKIHFHRRYLIRILRDSNFELVRSFRLTPFYTLSIAGTLILLVITATSLMIAYTPLKELIPGFPDHRLREQIIRNIELVDSLENELQLRDQYFATIQSILTGQDFGYRQSSVDTPQQFSNIDFSISKEDSLLREKVEKEEKFGLLYRSDQKDKFQLGLIHFFPPVKGIITNSFNPDKNHLGTDIVAPPNQVVSSILDGTVISATWSVEFGYVISIQHNHNLISFYKHNSELLRTTGSRIKAGEAIAIVGNSGELTTGPHLHFELWYNGTPMDPEDYINF